MPRGIHLKELRSGDLEAIGIPDDRRAGASDGENAGTESLLTQADPVLSQTLREVLQGLESARDLLDEALPKGSSLQAPPSLPEK